MKKYIKCIQYLFRHKWYVLKECFRIGLYWEGIAHDLSKFHPSEFLSYSEYFYGGGKNISEFEYSWLLHQKKNKHHWQWWVFPDDNGSLKILEMPDVCVKEMICDWTGAGRAKGNREKDECKTWYLNNKKNMSLHPNTVKKIEDILL